MASEIRVNTINNRSGLGTISLTNSGAVFSGVTTFAQIKTTSGEVTVGTGASVFSPATNVLALGTNNTEKVRITSTGSVGIGTDNPRTKLDVDGGLIVKVSGTQPAWVSNAIAGQEKFSIWQGASFDNACFSLDVDNGQSFLNHNVYYYSGWKQRLGGHTPIMIQLSSSNGVVFQKSSDNGAGTNDTATTLTELCRINTSGNLVFPSGQGIDFSATANGSGTTSSEILDDYEEGTWVPALFSGVDNGSGGAPSFDRLSGRYTKVGNTVFADFYIRFGAGTQTTGAYFAIEGLPFDVSNLSYGSPTGQWTRGAGASTYQDVTSKTLTFYGVANADRFNIYQDGNSLLLLADGTGIANKYIIGGFWYQTDS